MRGGSCTVVNVWYSDLKNCWKTPLFLLYHSPFCWCRKGGASWLSNIWHCCRSTLSDKRKKQKEKRKRMYSVFTQCATKFFYDTLKICLQPLTVYSRNTLVKPGHSAVWSGSFWRRGNRSTRSGVLPFPFSTILSSCTATVPKALLSGGVSITPSSVTWWTPVSWSRW